MYGVDRNGSMNKTSGGEEVALGPDPAVWNDDAAAVPISSKDPTWGSRSAPVTMVIFSDFQCPFCSRVEQTVNQLKDRYGKDKLRIVWKNNPLPFHPNAKPAATAAEAVFRLGGSAAFWKFHDAAFSNQKDLGPAKYEEWAAAAGVDKAKFNGMLSNPQIAAKIDADMAVGKSAGVTGTPASFINGVFLSGAQPVDKFTAIIDEQLAAAKAAIASGTKPEHVYVKLCNENKAKGPATPERKAPERPTEDDKTVWKIPLGNSAVKGKNTALVTIVEFSDFQCPFCSRAEPTLQEIEKTYGDKVRIVWKNEPLPFHNRAEPAAELALEAKAEKGDAGFWAAHDLMWKKECQGKADAKDKQSCESGGGKWLDNQAHIQDDDLIEYGKTLGLDATKVKAAITEHKHKAELDADQDVADDFQANGTPHFFINGRRLVGAQPFEKFKPIIDEEMKKAEALLSKGVAAKDIYKPSSPRTARSRPRPRRRPSTRLRRTAPPRAPRSRRSSWRSSATSSARSASGSRTR